MEGQQKSANTSVPGGGWQLQPRAKGHQSLPLRVKRQAFPGGPLQGCGLQLPSSSNLQGAVWHPGLHQQRELHSFIFLASLSPPSQARHPVTPRRDPRRTALWKGVALPSFDFPV